MRIFKTNDDIYYFGFLVFKKDEFIRFETDSYIITNDDVKFPLRITNVVNDKRFSEIDEVINIETREISENEDLEIKKYRIELDVFTTKKKLKEIEIFIKNNIETLL